MGPDPQAVLLGVAATRITLESQSEDTLKSFETGIINCPFVVRCFLMSGSDDYLVIVLARVGSHANGWHAPLFTELVDDLIGPH